MTIVDCIMNSVKLILRHADPIFVFDFSHFIHFEIDIWADGPAKNTSLIEKLNFQDFFLRLCDIVTAQLNLNMSWSLT